MEKILLSCVFLCCFCISCALVAPHMTEQVYFNVQEGMPAQDFIQIAGEPYKVVKREGYEEYQYIERFEIGPKMTHQTTYIFMIQAGTVVAKQKY